MELPMKIINLILDGKNIEVKDYLLENPEVVHSMGMIGSCLHLATSKNSLDLVEFLIGLGINVNLEGGICKWAAIHEAVVNGNVQIIRYLYNHGAIIDFYEEKKNLLFIATKMRKFEVLSLLIELGLDPYKKCSQSLSPIEYAKQIGDFECINIMTKNISKENTPTTKENINELDEIKMDIKQINIIVNQVVNEFRKQYVKPIVRIETLNEEVTLWDSKFGGTPYLPKDFEYPCKLHKDGSKSPLRLLAQLNFNDIPHLSDFPTKGILQFYMACDGTFGLDDHEYNDEQNSVRVIYHQDIIYDTANLSNAPNIEGTEEDFPLEDRALKLKFCIEQECINPETPICESLFVKRFNELSPEKIRSFSNLPLESLDLLHDENEALHKIGGFAHYDSDIIRLKDSSNTDYDIVLLQMGSEYPEEEEKPEISFSDGGDCTFMISSKDLKALNFNKIIYTWTCG